MERPLTSRIRADGQAVGLDAYRKAGGYEGLRNALRMVPQAVTQLVKESALRGRGGAGFYTGMKWSFVPMGPDAPKPKYFVCNADEMEPGTFKDRILMEGDPHQLIEGVAIGSYAIGAEVAFLFVRGEYTLAAARLEQAVTEARNAGYLGENILNSGYNLAMHVHTSAGRYICGEETALLNALEGKRANPRSKPPFPPVVGLWGKPTIVNNVETLCCVPHILRNGVDWFKGLSSSKDTGTKLYGASGRVRRPGFWELPIGTPLREILEEHAGGMRDGYRFRGLLPGGASTDFLTEQHLDVPMDFGGVQNAGSRLGTGTMIVLDDRSCPVGMTLNLTHFFAQESCGWCTPCWSGLRFAEVVLKRIEAGEGQPDDIDKLLWQTKFLGPGNTFCALAPGAAEPLQSALKYFQDDFEQHIRERHCPYKA